MCNYFKIHLLVKEKKSFKDFLFLALVAILFNGAERFGQFWCRVNQGTFLYNYFKIHPLVKAEKSFKGFSIFSSGGHFVQGAARFEQFW